LVNFDFVLGELIMETKEFPWEILQYSLWHSSPLRSNTFRRRETFNFIFHFIVLNSKKRWCLLRNLLFSILSRKIVGIQSLVIFIIRIVIIIFYVFLLNQMPMEIKKLNKLFPTFMWRKRLFSKQCLVLKRRGFMLIIIIRFRIQFK
jgi:hypothetical protein